MQREPDPLARLISHALVGAGVGYLLSRRGGAAGFWLGAVIAALAHEELDAPLATWLAERGV